MDKSEVENTTSAEDVSHLSRNRSFKSKQLVRSQAIRESQSPPRTVSPCVNNSAVVDDKHTNVQLNDATIPKNNANLAQNSATVPQNSTTVPHKNAIAPCHVGIAPHNDNTDSERTVNDNISDKSSHSDRCTENISFNKISEYNDELKKQPVEIQITPGWEDQVEHRHRTRRWLDRRHYSDSSRDLLSYNPRVTCVCGNCSSCPHCRGRRRRHFCRTKQDSGIVCSEDCPDCCDNDQGSNDGNKKYTSNENEDNLYCRCPDRKDKPKNISLSIYDSEEPSGIELVNFLKETLNKNAKDRMTLLKIEKELHALINDTGRCIVRFPVMTSYGRMLVHRCADLFQLYHHLDPANKSSVVVSKSGTSGGRIPCTEFKQWCTANFPPSPQRIQDTLAKSILKRDAHSLDEPSGGSHSMNRSKSLEQREREYERARRRIFSSDNCAQDESQWPWNSGPIKLLTPEIGRNKLLKVQSLESSGGASNTQSWRCRGPVSKSHSFSGAEQPRLLSRQGDLASSSWRLSPSSSGYKTLSLRSTDSVTPSPTGGASPEPGVGPIVGVGMDNAGVVWAVTDLSSVPQGAILYNPQTGRPLTNPDGSIYHFDPANPPLLFDPTLQDQKNDPNVEKKRGRLEKQHSFIDNDLECSGTEECRSKCYCECPRADVYSKPLANKETYGKKSSDNNEEEELQKTENCTDHISNNQVTPYQKQGVVLATNYKPSYESAANYNKKFEQSKNITSNYEKVADGYETVEENTNEDIEQINSNKEGYALTKISDGEIIENVENLGREKYDIVNKKTNCEIVVNNQSYEQLADKRVYDHVNNQKKPYEEPANHNQAAESTTERADFQRQFESANSKVIEQKSFDKAEPTNQKLPLGDVTKPSSKLANQENQQMQQYPPVYAHGFRSDEIISSPPGFVSSDISNVMTTKMTTGLPDPNIRPLSLTNVMYPTAVPQYPYMNHCRLDGQMQQSVYTQMVHEDNKLAASPHNNDTTFRIDPSYPYSPLEYGPACGACVDNNMQQAHRSYSVPYGQVEVPAVLPPYPVPVPNVLMPHHIQSYPYQDAMQWSGVPAVAAPKLYVSDIYPMVQYPTPYPQYNIMYPQVIPQPYSICPPVYPVVEKPGIQRRNSFNRKQSISGSARTTPQTPDVTVPYEKRDNEIALKIQQIKEQMAQCHVKDRDQDRRRDNWKRRNSGNGILGNYPASYNGRIPAGPPHDESQLSSEARAIVNSIRNMQPKHTYHQENRRYQDHRFQSDRYKQRQDREEYKGEKHDRGQNNDSRGQNNDTRGTNADSKGHNNDTRGHNNDARGYNNDTRGHNNDTRGNNTDTRGPGHHDGARPEFRNRTFQPMYRPQYLFRQMSPGTWCRRSPGPLHSVNQPRRPHPDSRNSRR